MSDYTLKRELRYYKRQLEQSRKKIATLTEQIKQNDELISRAFDLATHQTQRATALKKKDVK